MHPDSVNVQRRKQVCKLHLVKLNLKELKWKYNIPIEEMFRCGSVTQFVECLSTTHESLGSIPSTI